MKTYRVIYERDESGAWIVDIPDVAGCHTHGRTIEQARERIREALSACVPPKTAAAAKFNEEIRLPDRVKRYVRTVKDLRARLVAMRNELAKVERKAVKGLRKDAKLGHRDAGEILGLSHQRVHQLDKTG